MLPLPRHAESKGARPRQSRKIFPRIAIESPTLVRPLIRSIGRYRSTSQEKSKLLLALETLSHCSTSGRERDDHATFPRHVYRQDQFPRILESYIKTEIEAIREKCEVRIITTKKASMPAKSHLPFCHIDKIATIREAIEDFRPDVLHTHWLHSARLLGELSKQCKIPFTVRTHSFDSIWDDARVTSGWGRIFSGNSLPPHVREAIRFIRSDLCLGILAFPFNRARLEKAGISGDKITDSYPVVNYPLFHDTGPDGYAIMNMGAAITKKKMEDFIDLGSMLPGRTFNLYAMAYDVDKLRKLNENKGEPVNIITPVEPKTCRRSIKNTAGLSIPRVWIWPVSAGPCPSPKPKPRVSASASPTYVPI